MTNQIDNMMTLGATLITMRCGDTPLATGSGFFWRLGSRRYLITNWHNLSGRNPDDGKPMSSTGGIPDMLEYSVYRNLMPDDAAEFEVVPTTVSVPLLESDRPLWLEHPILGSAVDVVALPLDDKDHDGMRMSFANELYPDLQRSSYVSQDAFVIGFPLGALAQPLSPIWKRASVATEPGIDLNEMPKLLIDTATRTGMSGSIVLADHLIFGAVEFANGTTNTKNFVTRQLSILGVYSGRLGQGELQAQLGVVWKKRVIDEILNTFDATTSERSK